MDFRQLRHVVVLTRLRNYAKAARELGLTQSALSRSIDALEASLGVRLFDRGRGGVFPTREGTNLALEAEGLLHQADAIKRSLKSAGGGESGEVVFGIAPLPASIVLADVLASMIRDRPGIIVQANVHPPQTLLESLTNDVIDFYVSATGTVPTRPDLVVTPVAPIPIATLVRTDHPLLAQGFASPRDITGYPLIAANTANVGQSGQFPKGTPFEILGTLVIACNNYETLKAVTLTTDAIWVTSPWAAQTEIEDGRMQVLPIKDLQLPHTVDFAMVSHVSRPPSPAAKVVYERVVAAFNLRQSGGGNSPVRRPNARSDNIQRKRGNRRAK